MYISVIRRKFERGSANDLANREDGQTSGRKRIANRDGESDPRESGTQNRMQSQALRGLA